MKIWKVALLVAFFACTVHGEETAAEKKNDVEDLPLPKEDEAATFNDELIDTNDDDANEQSEDGQEDEEENEREEGEQSVDSEDEKENDNEETSDVKSKDESSDPKAKHYYQHHYKHWNHCVRRLRCYRKCHRVKVFGRWKKVCYPRKCYWRRYCRRCYRKCSRKCRRRFFVFKKCYKWQCRTTCGKFSG